MNLALAAVDHFNRFLGLGPAIVSREPWRRRRRERCRRTSSARWCARRRTPAARSRDRRLLLYTALRLSELVALDVADARLSARKGLLIVRAGKGDFYREVPMNSPSATRSRRG